jgi:TolB-like protein/Tfp pilus assembly protein PilF
MSFITELKRRNVIRVALAYLAVAWLLIQVSETILPLFGFGSGAARVVVIFFGVAFLPTLVLAWTFEFTSEGFKLDRDVVQTSKEIARSSKSFDRVLIVLLVLALSYFAFDKFLLSPSRESAAVEAVRKQVTTEVLESAKASAFDSSVAVLSFTNSSDDPSNDYLSEGLSDELRDRVAQLPSMRVVARSSSIRFRDQELDATMIASQLGVSRVIEGRFNRQGNRIMLSVELIDATTGFQLWSQSYERASRDLLLLQQDLARAVAGQLVPELSIDEEIRAPTAQQISAHDLMLLGRQFEQQVTDQQLVDESILRKAIDYYRRAITEDPQLAEAHARLGKMLLYVGNIDEGEGAIFEALRLDPRLSDAHATLGVYYYATRQPGTGDAYKRAIEFNPNNADALSNYAGWLWLQGEPENATDYYRRALEIDPMSLLRYTEFGYKLAFSGRREEAEQILSRILELFPTAPGYLAAARIADAYGAPDQAIAFSLKARLLRPDDLDIAGQLAGLHAQIGDFESAALFEPEPGMGQLMWQRRYPELIDLAQELMIDQPGDVEVLYLLAFALNTEERFQESVRVLNLTGMSDFVLRESRRANETHYLPTLITALQATGDTDKARELAEWNLEFNQKMSSGQQVDTWVNHFAEACALSILDRDEESLAVFEKLQDVPAIPRTPWVKDHTCFRKFQNEPRYRAVVSALDARLAAIRERLPATLEQYGLLSESPAQK